MTQPSYRCVECSQPAPAGQLLCAACTARVATRRPPPQPPYQPTSAVSPVSPTGPTVTPTYPSASVPPLAPPLNGNISPPPAFPARLDLLGNPLPDSPAPSNPAYAPSAGYSLPQNANRPQQYTGTNADPDVLLAQLKQAEGGKYPSPQESTFLERFGRRMARRFIIRAVLGGVVALLAIITRLSGGVHAHTTSTTDSDSRSDMPMQSAYSRTASGTNSLAAARSSMNGVTPLAASAQTQEIEAAITRVNRAWTDVENTMQQADFEMMRTDRRPDLTPFAQQLEVDYNIVKQALPFMPLQEHEQCVHMMHAIESAQNELLRQNPASFVAVPTPNPYAGVPSAPPNMPARNGDPSTSGNGASTGQPGQPPSMPQENGTPLQPQNPAPGANAGSGPPAGGTTAPTPTAPEGTVPPGQGSVPPPNPPGTAPPPSGSSGQ